MNDPTYSSEVSLTFGQKVQLLLECLPLLFFVLAFVFCMTILDDITGAPPPTALLLFLGLVILVVGWTAIQRTRDLVSGVALVQEDLLERAYRSGGSTRHPFRGRFAQLGTLRLTTPAYGQVVHTGPHSRYRVSYSPASKIVWSLEKLG
jgi:hypothetical protein